MSIIGKLLQLKLFSIEVEFILENNQGDSKNTREVKT